MAINVAKIEHDFQTGLKLIHDGQIPEAENKLLSILKYIPENPVLLERIGYCCALQSDWKNAEKYYYKAMELTPENTETLNNYGCVLQKQNKWEEALPFFRKSYKIQPDNYSALSNLAQTLNFCKKYKEAITYYTLAIEKQPENSPMRFQLAQILHEQERFDEEITQYRLLIAMNGENTKAQVKMALALFASGSIDQATGLIKSINQDIDGLAVMLFDWAKQSQEKELFPEAAYSLGLLVEIAPENLEFWRTYVINHYFAFGLEKSLPVFEKALAAFPKEPSFYRALAIAYGQAGRLEESKDAAKKVMEISPDDAKAHQTYAVVLRQLQKSEAIIESIDECCTHFQKAILLALKNPPELQAIGQSIVETKETAIMSRIIGTLPVQLKDSFLPNLLRNFICVREGDYPTAIKHGEKCRELAPNNSFALSELAETYFYMENYEAALKTSREAVAANPKDSQALMRLGYIAIDCGEIEEGLERAEQAFNMNPHDPAVQLSLGLMNLLVENWERGWEMYSARFKMQYKNRIDIPPLPHWDGQSFQGLELVLVCEQGLGDIIQFARFIPQVAKLAKKVVFVANSSLSHLFEHYSDIIEVIPNNTKFSIDQENGRWVSLVELPHLMHIDKEDWGQNVPYIQAQPERISKWASLINKNDNKLKVGIAWQGTPGARIDVGRSIPLQNFEPLSLLPDVRLISLQKYTGEEQIEEVSFKSRIETLGDDFDNGPQAFADTAAVMDVLDLVITSDTSIAHLAGALGKPVWLALKHVPDWRWHLNTEKSIWYPTMKLFRQKVPGIWDNVFEAITEELQKIAKSKN